MKLSKRLSTIAQLINKQDYPADVGCDHAYLSIYLAENVVENIVATEIVNGPYSIAKNNIMESSVSNKIHLYLTDGLKGVEENINTIIISGMGAHTIIHILEEYKNINNISKIIIQSNNDLELIRRYMYKIGYYIEQEYYSYDKKHEYITMLFYKGTKSISNMEYKFGKYNYSLDDYYKNLITKYDSLIKKVTDATKKEEIINDINYLKDKIKNSK